MDVFNTFLSSTFSFSLNEILFIVLVFLFIGFLVLIGVVLNLGSRLRYLTYPVYDFVVKEAQQEANRILEDAEEQSRAIRARAQMEGGKLLVDRKKEDEQFREKHEQQIVDITTHAKEVLSKQTANVHKLSEDIVLEFKQYAQNAGALIQEESALVKRSVAEEVQRMNSSLAEMSKKTEKEYEVLMAETKKQVAEGLAKEIQTMRDAVVTYQKDRFTLLDQEIVVLVEETARIVLQKELTLKDQEEMVRKALDDAKKEGIFN